MGYYSNQNGMNFKGITENILNKISKGVDIDKILPTVDDIELFKCCLNLYNMNCECADNAILKHYLKNNINDNRILCISDSHIGGNNEYLKMIDYVYEYAQIKNIKNIINAGDIIEGKCNMYCSSFSPDKQMELLEYRYPNVPGIMTYFIHGNHDYYFRMMNGKNINDVLLKRDNMKYLGSAEAYIGFNKNLIKISHLINKYDYQLPKTDYEFEVFGHSHYHELIPQYRAIRLPSLGEFGDNHPGIVEIRDDYDEYLVSYFDWEKNSYNEYKLEKIRK